MGFIAGVAIGDNGDYVATTGTGQTITINASEIRRIANTEVGGAFDRLATALGDFKSLEEGSGIFGGSQPGEELGSLHASVKDVFVATVDGVTTDLDTFNVNLAKGADNWDQADLSSAERSNQLAAYVEAGTQRPLATDQSWNDSRERAGDSLAPGQELSAKQEELKQQAEEQVAQQPEQPTAQEPSPAGPQEEGGL